MVHGPAYLRCTHRHQGTGKPSGRPEALAVAVQRCVPGFGDDRVGATVLQGNGDHAVPAPVFWRTDSASCPITAAPVLASPTTWSKCQVISLSAAVVMSVASRRALLPNAVYTVLTPTSAVRAIPAIVADG